MPGLFIRRHALSVSGIYKVAVLYVHPDSKLKAKPYDLELADGPNLLEVRLYYRTGKTGIKNLDSLINLIRFFKAHLKGFRIINKKFGSPDLLHVNVLTRHGVIALIYKLLTRVPYVITEHWTRYLPGMNTYEGWLRKMLTRVVVKNASALMPVTLNLQHSMQKHSLFNNNYHVIPNVVDANLFNIKDSLIDLSRKMFLHVSCFDDNQKNISGILRVLKQLSLKRQDWVCNMIGEGKDYEQLVKYAEELSLDGSLVIFTGLKENQELADLMKQACFQFLFSRYENLPVVIPESFACGVPFISTSVGGIAEHINENLGLLIESEDEIALLKAIEYMLDNTAKFDEATIRQYAIDHFSKEVIGQQIHKVYENVIHSEKHI
jgi:glycosyltransferase involved in cell wall biosynthesis